MTFNQFERQVREIVEDAVPECYKTTHFASAFGFAKLTTTVQGDVAILYAGTDSALPGKTAHANRLMLQRYELTEAGARNAADVVIKCLNGA